MDKDSKRQKRRDDALSLLDAAIEAVNLAKEISSPTPAKAVFGTVSTLLTTIRVHLLLFCIDGFQVDMYLGLDEQQIGLRRAWTGLCRNMWRSQARNEREETGGP